MPALPSGEQTRAPVPEDAEALRAAGPAPSFHAPWSIVWIAFTVRVLYMTLAHTYRFRPYEDHFQFAWEMGRIARALVTGYGYADPFFGHTGPTAWVAPLFPLLLAAVFKVFGVYTLTSAWVILTIDCFFSALVVRTTWEIGARCCNRSVARWAAWMWALYPAAMQYAVRWVWEMTLTCLLFSWVIVLALRMRNIGVDSASVEAAMTGRRWALFGLAWGAIALSNPSLLLFLPVSGWWVLRGAPNWRRQAGRAALAALIVLACIAPWTWRNWRAFHQFVPMRGNFGAEFYLGNGPEATGLLTAFDHPTQAPDQLRLYHQMGEIAYAKMRGRITMALIRQRPWRFARLTLKRIFFFWGSVPHPMDNPWEQYTRNFNLVFTSVCGLLGLGLALRRRVPGADLFAWAFLLLPLLYYFVSVHARFRHPLEPLIAVLGVYLFQSAERRRPALTKAGAASRLV